MIQKAQLPVHLLTTDFPPSHGGLETYSWELSQSLPGLRHISAATGLSPDQIRSCFASRPVQFLPHGRRGRIGAGLWSAFDSLRHSSKHGIRLHMQWTTAAVSWLQRRFGQPFRYVVLVHGSELADRRSWVKTAMRMILENADAVIAGSHFTRQYLLSLGIRPRRLEVNYYGVAKPPPPEQRASPGRKETLQLLGIHRLVARKGTQDLLHALAAPDLKAWKLTLAGDGPEKARLERLAKSLGIKRQVEFLGNVGEETKKSLLGKTDLFILPSLPPGEKGRLNHIEGLGLGLLDAQAYGLPVLAADTGGIPEAMADGHTGWLYRSGSPEDLKGKLQEILKSPEELARRGAMGPGFVESHFTWEKNRSYWAKLFSEWAE